MKKDLLSTRSFCFETNFKTQRKIAIKTLRAREGFGAKSIARKFADFKSPR